MPKVMVILLAFMVLTGCNKKEAEQLAVTENLFEAGVLQGEPDTHELEEASGLAASVANPGLLWTHNDGGDEARIFLIDEQAHLRSTAWFENVKLRDWEDMAVGPGPTDGKSYVYVGDIGDNDAKYKYKFIYRVEEPVIDWNR